MTYEQALEYLESFVNYERSVEPAAMRQLKLERMVRLCQRLGEPQRAFRAVLVAGTNGKGSIGAMLYAMLRESLLRVGLYTSPHLEDLRERIRVSVPEDNAAPRGETGDWIGATEFADVVTSLRPILEEPRGASGGAPTYFEVLTAAAFVYFQRRKVEIAVLEVGLGGRLDATNVVEPTVAVLSPIDVDHAAILGSDPVLIASEKAGIIKPHATVISSPQPPEVDEVLRLVCAEQGVPLLRCGRDLTARIQDHDLDGLQVTLSGLRGIYESVALPLIGRHQAENAAVAVGALEALADGGIPRILVERGLPRVTWPGRIEVVHEAPLVVMDGAHNPAALRALRETLGELCPGRGVHLLVGMSSDKPVEALGEQLGRYAASATCSQGRHARALEARQLARRLGPYCPNVHVVADAADALTYLMNAVSPDEVIVVTGSLWFVGELRAAFRRAHVRPRPVAEA